MTWSTGISEEYSLLPTGHMYCLYCIVLLLLHCTACICSRVVSPFPCRVTRDLGGGGQIKQLNRSTSIGKLQVGYHMDMRIGNTRSSQLLRGHNINAACIIVTKDQKVREVREISGWILPSPCGQVPKRSSRNILDSFWTVKMVQPTLARLKYKHSGFSNYVVYLHKNGTRLEMIK